MPSRAASGRPCCERAHASGRHPPSAAAVARGPTPLARHRRAAHRGGRARGTGWPQWRGQKQFAARAGRFCARQLGRGLGAGAGPGARRAARAQCPRLAASAPRRGPGHARPAPGAAPDRPGERGAGRFGPRTRHARLAQLDTAVPARPVGPGLRGAARDGLGRPRPGARRPALGR